MKILGVIAEYNPFHLGHEYHIKKSKELTGANCVIAIMSGSFVQRGEPAALDKWSRAKMALSSGIDLVIELPFIYSTQSAELFAEGAIKLLDGLNVIDYLSFGSEHGHLDELYKIAQVLNDEPIEYKKYLKEYLIIENSFPVARELALNKYFKDFKNLNKIMRSSNNILAIEYLKALLKYNSKIKPFTLKRIGANYNDPNLSKDISSATSIRNNLSNYGLKNVNKFMNIKSYDILNNFFIEYNKINSLIEYEEILLYKLRTTNKEYFNLTMGLEHGLGNRIINNSYKYDSLESIINKSISKTHTKTRIQRSLIHFLNGLTKKDFINLNKRHPEYIRVLAANNSGLKILNKISKKSELPIITKFANYNRKNSMIKLDKQATDIYFLPFKNKPFNLDFYTSPIIDSNI